MKKQTKTVPTYALRPLLSDAQWEAVKPFVRATFSETWAAMRTPGNGSYRARWALRLLAGNGVGPTWGDATRAEGLAIERVLYERARRLGHPVIAGPARSGGAK